jgi:hypothetical protein
MILERLMKTDSSVGRKFSTSVSGRGSGGDLSSAGGGTDRSVSHLHSSDQKGGSSYNKSRSAYQTEDFLTAGVDQSHSFQI